MNPYKEFLKKFPSSYKQARGSNTFNLNERGATLIRSINNQFMFNTVSIPERLILMGLFTQTTPEKFECLVKLIDRDPYARVLIHELVRMARILGVNTVLKDPEFRAADHSLEKFYNRIHGERITHTVDGKRETQTIEYFYDANLKGKEKDACINFEILTQMMDGNLISETPPKQDNTAIEVKPQPTSPHIVKPVGLFLQHLIQDCIKIIFGFVSIIFISFFFGALNNSFASFIINPFFVIICLLSSIFLLISTDGFDTFKFNKN